MSALTWTKTAVAEGAERLIVSPGTVRWSQTWRRHLESHSLEPDKGMTHRRRTAVVTGVAQLITQTAESSVPSRSGCPEQLPC